MNDTAPIRILAAITNNRIKKHQVTENIISLWLFTIKVVPLCHYYLHDCYPLQFADTDEVIANRKKNAAQWETFTKYLESKGKLHR